jgi:hypothetical protein
MSKIKPRNDASPESSASLPVPVQGQLIKIDPESDPLLFHYTDEDDDERRRIWAEANEGLRGVIAEVAEWIVNTYRSDILRRYRLAELVKKVYDDEVQDRSPRYGSHAVKQIADFFGWQSGMIYHALRLARAYTYAQVEELNLRRLRDGKPVCYYHIQLLTGIDDPALREELLARTLEESWSTDDLAEVIVELNEKKKKVKDGRGRPLAIPRNLDAVIHQQSRAADDFLSRSQKVWEQPEHSLLAKAQDPFEEFSEERVAQLKAHAQKMRALADEAGKRAEEAERAYEYVVQVVETRKEKAEVKQRATDGVAA